MRLDRTFAGCVTEANRANNKLVVRRSQTQLSAILSLVQDTLPVRELCCANVISLNVTCDVQIPFDRLSSSIVLVILLQ